MRKAGVIGWPVAHSLSPKLHQFWLKKYGIDGSYEALAVEPKNLSTFIRDLSEQNFVGANVTVPHKETVMPLLDEIDEIARVIGAVNTIIIKDEKLRGTNTDAFGFAENLKSAGLPAARNKAVVLGAGGAARAACKALSDMKFSHIVIVNRTLTKAKAIAKNIHTKVEVVDWSDRNASLEDTDVLVNATSLGLKSGVPLDINLDMLPKEAVVTDMVYVPLETPLLQQAKAHGNKTIDGLNMLLWQAVPGFEAWFGVRPEVSDALRAEVLSG